MLHEINIRNFVVIEQLSINFTEGLNVLTGETGTGKSIIIDALSIALGSRASAELIREGAEKAVVEAIFEINQVQSEIMTVLADLGIELAEDLVLVLCREITRNGKSVCRVNGRVVTLAMLRQIGQHLVNLHGQHDYQSLFHAERHRELLDAFGGTALLDCLHMAAALAAKEREIRGAMQKYAGNPEERARQLDLLQYQLNEINEAGLEPGEDERLRDERKRLLNAEELRSGSGQVYALLRSGIQGRQAVLDQLGEALTLLKRMAELDPQLQTITETTESLLYQLEDAAAEIRNYKEAVTSSPAELAAVEERLDLLNSLKRKYGKTLAKIAEYAAGLVQEIDFINQSDQEIAGLMEKHASVVDEYAKTAAQLSQMRAAAAAQLSCCMQAELRDLGMPRAAFSVQQHRDSEKISSVGIDEIEFLFTANPGEPQRPLAKVASGGEMARIMLALKKVLLAVDPVPTMIFDEIDVGIGGRTAQAVAEKVAAIARHCQVICITHLPQTASMGDTHYAIRKTVVDERTYVQVQQLDQTARVAELARMAGGAELTRVTEQHARELLQMAAAIKQSLK